MQGVVSAGPARRTVAFCSTNVTFVDIRVVRAPVVGSIRTTGEGEPGRFQVIDKSDCAEATVAKVRA